MEWLIRFARSSIGAKALVAGTGAALTMFVFGHMIGNLQIFQGPEALNTYAEFLQGLTEPLWVIRSGLLVIFVVHVYFALSLTLKNWGARDIGYQNRQYKRATLASRTMWIAGVVVFFFVLYHLAHLTLGLVLPETHTFVDAEGRKDVYKMTVLGFQQWWVTVPYVLANLGLALHISHGGTAMFQTLGLKHPKYEPLTRLVGPTIGVLIALGNTMMPIAAMIGILKIDGGV